MVIFPGFGRFLEGITALTSALEELATTQRGLGPASDRLEVLERARHQFEAECEGMLLKADGKLKAAANAEARERQLKKAAQRLTDPFPEEGEARTEPAPVFGNHVAAGEAPGVSPVRVALAPTGKAFAVRAKFGL